MLEQQLVVGRTYRFTFKSEFERHGVCTTGGVTCLHKGNGIFRLEQIATFKDIVLSGADLYGSFFKPLNITDNEYKQYFSGKPMDEFEAAYTTVPVATERIETVDVPDGQGGTTIAQRRVVGNRQQIVENGTSAVRRHFVEELSYGSFPIYKLVDVIDNDDIVYVPEKAIKGFPEVGIQEYQDLTLAIDVGYWANPTTLDGVLNAVRERLAVYGIQPLKIDLFSADSMFMNPDEYEKIKSIRVPGSLVKVTNVNQETYVGQVAVVDGELKKIVAQYPTKGGKPVTEEYDEAHKVWVKYIDLESIISKENQIIDPLAFFDKGEDGGFVPLSPTEAIFESENFYYTSETIKNGSKTCEGFRKLVEGQDWVAGDPVPHFQVTSDETAIEGKTYYRSKGPSYSVIPMGNSYALALGYLASNAPVYYAEETFTQCSSSEVAVDGVRYFKRDSSGKFIYQDVHSGDHLDSSYYKGSFPNRDESDGTFSGQQPIEATKAFVEANPKLQYFKMESPAIYEKLSLGNGENVPTGSYTRQIIFKSNFASQYAYDLVAKKFVYTNKLGSLVTTELTAEEITGLAYDESHQVRISNDVVQRKYNGRWFEYTEMIRCTTDMKRDAARPYYRQSEDGSYIQCFDGDGSGLPPVGSPMTTAFFQERTLAVVISSSNYSAYSDKPGVVLGEIGEVYKETFIEDKTLNKNYFALFTQLLQENTAQSKENETLKKLVRELSDENLQLRKKIKDSGITL